jgi:AraC-like DNA-binding protein
VLYRNIVTSNFDTSSMVIPAHGKVRAGYFAGFPTLVGNLGGDCRKILEGRGIDPFVFNDPDNDVDCMAAVDLLEYTSRYLKEPLFGLRLAEQQDPDVFGCVMALARSAPNLRLALQSLIDYVPVSASPECELEMVSSQKTAELRWRAPNGLSDNGQVSYHGVLLIMKTLKMLGKQHFRPRYASLTLSIGKHETKLLQEQLGCKIHGGAIANAIAFPIEILDSPIATSNRTLFNLLSAGLSQLRMASKASFIEQVEANVRRGILTGQSTLPDCAKKLATSVRTLQKRLNEMGANYIDIVQRERIKLAKHSLRWTDSSLDEISLQLGYAEQTSFGRAFKRATGLTPKEFRLRKDCE